MNFSITGELITPCHLSLTFADGNNMFRVVDLRNPVFVPRITYFFTSVASISPISASTCIMSKSSHMLVLSPVDVQLIWLVYSKVALLCS